MAFRVTMGWLQDYYGSLPSQVDQTRDWLNKYGNNVPPDRLEEWSKFKHLSEYQVNTNDIVDICLQMVGAEFETELEAHRFINLLRVPLAGSYEAALEIVKPKMILEIGVGGDSSISTSVFLRYVERVGGQLDSVDINPLGMTWERYKPFTDLWTFTQSDGLIILSMAADKGVRYGMVFIDSSHSYSPTLAEMLFASKITDYMLMDDATFEGNTGDIEQGGVKRAIEEWCSIYPEWEKKELWGGAVVLLSRKKKEQ